MLFGALVWYKELYSCAYGPKGEPGLFRGAELVGGMLFKGNYKVWPIESNDGVFKEFVTRTISIPNEKWRFPALKKALEVYTPSIPREENVEDKEPGINPALDADNVGAGELDLGDLALDASKEPHSSSSVGAIGERRN